MQGLSVLIIGVALTVILGMRMVGMISYPPEMSVFLFVIGLANLINMIAYARSKPWRQ